MIFKSKTKNKQLSDLKNISQYNKNIKSYYLLSIGLIVVYFQLTFLNAINLIVSPTRMQSFIHKSYYHTSNVCCQKISDSQLQWYNVINSLCIRINITYNAPKTFILYKILNKNHLYCLYYEQYISLF